MPTSNNTDTKHPTSKIDGVELNEQIIDKSSPKARMTPLMSPHIQDDAGLVKNTNGSGGLDGLGGGRLP